jgi:V-type H+-transporting ATPase subunit F
LAGIGHTDTKNQSNFLVVDSSISLLLTRETPLAKIEESFEAFTLRKDIAIILVNQHVADMIRPMIDSYHQAFPTVLEIPSKDHPYDPAKARSRLNCLGFSLEKDLKIIWLKMFYKYNLIY